MQIGMLVYNPCVKVRIILIDKEFLLKIYNKIPNLLKYIPYNIYANNEFNKFQIYVLLDKGEVSLIRIILI
jgi:hypothetical protein